MHVWLEGEVLLGIARMRRGRVVLMGEICWVRREVAQASRWHLQAPCPSLTKRVRPEAVASEVVSASLESLEGAGRDRWWELGELREEGVVPRWLVACFRVEADLVVSMKKRQRWQVDGRPPRPSMLKGEGRIPVQAKE